ncbi:MAG: hypothetical protein M1812_001618 [Candelaria pacifica]|nr:MAG: hypothetical protein M1812_001618 [Candelaria pacifica]
MANPRGRPWTVQIDPVPRIDSIDRRSVTRSSTRSISPVPLLSVSSCSMATTSPLDSGIASGDNNGHRSGNSGYEMDHQYLWGFRFPEDQQLTSRAIYPPSDRSVAHSTYAASAAPSSSSQQTGPAVGSIESVSGQGSVAESLAQFSFEGSGESSSSKSPLDMGLGFLKNLTEKKTTRDGQTPKRRGPKPDAKPAMTRRQELNRQAQRTHRERKELYIKALEQEVTRLKESSSETTRERDAYKEENRQLREVLRTNNIQAPGNGYANTSSTSTDVYGGSSSGSFSSSYPSGALSQEQGFRTPPVVSSGYGPPPNPPLPRQGSTGQLQRPRVDHDQSDEDVHGHALMASCPREQDILDPQAVLKPCPTSNVQRADLRSLMESCSRLELDGEITPVMAWSIIWGDSRLNELTPRDFAVLKEDLGMKVRCYGFGAVLEEFEVRDALSNVFATKIESYVGFN